ncbi:MULTISPECIES: MarR family winged helix-turn-helix transcriptional regulator [unclassified Rhodosalinus]|uniref:MarR family winged helix-turn-helix transcriptional regulator n=1 Tax=unclassified Rhodosalinus TaxID=2630183 RepID=UPI003525073A
MPRRADTIPPPAETRVSDAGLRVFIGYHMRRAMAALQADLADTLAPFGLRMIPFSVLVLIVDNPGLRPSQIAEALAIERSNLVSLIDGLAREGLVVRQPVAGDRRAHALSATARGAALCARARAAVAQHDARMSAGLDETTRTRLIGFLNRVENSDGRG